MWVRKTEETDAQEARRGAAGRGRLGDDEGVELMPKSQTVTGGVSEETMDQRREIQCGLAAFDVNIDELEVKE